MLYHLATFDPIEDLGLLRPAFLRQKYHYGTANRLFCAVAEYRLCSLVPTRDRAPEVETDHGVRRRMNDRRQPLGSKFRLLPLGDLHGGTDHTPRFSAAHDRGVRVKPGESAVRS